MTDRTVLLEASRFRVARYEYETDGTRHAREIVEHPGSVTIVPLVEGRRVCLIRNHRIAVGDWLLELPAGTREPGEPAETTARRELKEETGWRAASLECIHQFWMSPGILNERMHLFVAQGLTTGPQALDAGEQIEPHVVTWDEALAMVDDQRICDAKTLAGLLVCDRWVTQRELAW